MLELYKIYVTSMMTDNVLENFEAVLKFDRAIKYIIMEYFLNISVVVSLCNR